MLAVCAVWIFTTAATPNSTTGGRIPAPRKGFLAPDLQLKDLEGNSVSLRDLRGQAVLLNFWASWCSPCKAEMPAMQAMYESYQAQGMVIVGVNTTYQDDETQVRRFVIEHGLTFPILLDDERRAAASYGVRAMPTSFFIDREGVIREVIVGGPMSEALLRSQAETLTRGNP